VTEHNIGNQQLVAKLLALQLTYYIAAG
jgi:hypothetical protein